MSGLGFLTTLYLQPRSRQILEALFGGADGIRTHDLFLTKEVHYHCATEPQKIDLFPDIFVIPQTPHSIRCFYSSAREECFYVGVLSSLW